MTIFFFLLSRSACSDRIEFVILISSCVGFGTAVAVFLSPSFSALVRQQLLMSRAGVPKVGTKAGGGELCKTLTCSESLFMVLVRLEIHFSAAVLRFFTLFSRYFILWSCLLSYIKQFCNFMIFCMTFEWLILSLSIAFIFDEGFRVWVVIICCWQKTHFAYSLPFLVVLPLFCVSWGAWSVALGSICFVLWSTSTFFFCIT